MRDVDVDGRQGGCNSHYCAIAAAGGKRKGLADGYFFFTLVSVIFVSSLIPLGCHKMVNVRCRVHCATKVKTVNRLRCTCIRIVNKQISYQLLCINYVFSETLDINQPLI